MASNLEKATFGAGCFWGVEETFRTLPGVINTSVGYMGGSTENPTYEAVCSNQTGHVEVVQIEFDPNLINYGELLKVFWENHDPTQIDRQGPDVGSQYRSVVFCHSEEQKNLAEKAKTELEISGKFKGPIVTVITPAETFYLAEDYHQKYLMKRGLNICH